MNRLFKYILLLASVVCNFSCEKEIDLNEYTVTKIYYRTSDDKPITQSDGWNSEFDSQILADSYSADNGGCLLVYGNVTVFGTWFQGNSSLIEVTIPLGIKSISDYAFCNCSSLTSVTIGDSVTTIGSWAFSYCDRLASVTIPDSVTTIGDGAFYDCVSLIVVTICDSVTTIGDSAFCHCSNLTSVTIGNSVTTIGDGAFQSCSSLTSVTIGDSVTTIGDGAFLECSNLTSVTIGNSVTTIGDGAFYSCKSLTSIYCEATTPPSLGAYVFDSFVSNRKIYVPAQSVEAYKSAKYWKNYALAIVGYDF